MNTFLILTILACHCARSVTAILCVCTDTGSEHVDRAIYSCPDSTHMPAGFLYHSSADERCIEAEAGVLTSHDWYAGIYYDQVVYVQRDDGIIHDHCLKPAKGHVTFNPTCQPTMNPGYTLNPTPTTSTTTTTTTTTKRPLTTPTTKPTTPPTTPTTLKKIQVTIPPTTFSKKCQFIKLVLHQTQKTSARHPDAKACPDGSHTFAEALLFETCNNVNTDIFTWRQGVRVTDNCYSIPKGEPLVYYFGGRPYQGLSALFWGCTASGTSFEVAFQTCGQHVQVFDIATKGQLTKENFYTVSW